VVGPFGRSRTSAADPAASRSSIMRSFATIASESSYGIARPSFMGADEANQAEVSEIIHSLLEFSYEFGSFCSLDSCCSNKNGLSGAFVFSSQLFLKSLYWFQTHVFKATGWGGNGNRGHAQTARRRPTQPRTNQPRFKAQTIELADTMCGRHHVHQALVKCGPHGARRQIRRIL
jgi:hypothetical protein